MSQLSEDDHADLVAYLDGEMDEETAQAFEARLGRDADLRAEAEALKRTWELLDYLPRPEPSGGFTQRTLERLAVRETTRQAVYQPRKWAWAAPVGWAAAMLIAMGSGLFVAHELWPPPANPTPPLRGQPGPNPGQAEFDAKMARNLGPIENLRIYNHVDDLGFSRALPAILEDEEEGS